MATMRTYVRHHADVSLGRLPPGSARTAASQTRLLPVAGPLAPLLPDGGLRRGSVVQCDGAGSRRLALALVAEASAAGSWCVFVGATDLGALSAAEHGVALSLPGGRARPRRRVGGGGRAAGRGGRPRGRHPPASPGVGGGPPAGGEGVARRGGPRGRRHRVARPPRRAPGGGSGACTASTVGRVGSARVG